MELFIKEYLEAYREMGPEAFRQKFDHLFLLFPEKHVHGELKTYHTRMAERDEAGDLWASGRKLDEFRVLTPGSAHAGASEHFLVGRGEDRDLSIDHSTVSKRHAFFIRDERTGTYLLGDAGSTNGTFVNGQRVESGKSVPLKDGMVVSFGDCDYLFLTPDGFAALVEKMSRR